MGVAIAVASAAAVLSSLPQRSPAAPQPANDVSTFPGLPDPGPITSIEIAPKTDADPAKLSGPDARLQLVVTANHATGQLRDLTRSVTYTAEPANVVRVDPTGSVVPLADGEARITAKSASGAAATIDVTVTDFASPPPINFRNQVVPIFTKLGCNSGGCHGKSGGQNGFRLSLLGFEPQQDYRYLVRESRGRRLFPAAPAESLLLTKATNMLAHGGGERVKQDSADYRLLYRWIAQGMPYGSENDPTLTGVSVFPTSRILPRDGSQQLRAVAHYSDGSSEDVTQSAQFEPNDKEMAQVDGTGNAKMLGRPGEVAVMVRYRGQVATFGATIPLGVPVAQLPPAKNYIDELVFEKLKDLGLPPSPVCDDATFVRRVTLDLTGRLPTADQSRAFLADTDPAKRDKLIDHLLDSEGYADFFASKWNDILRNKRDREGMQRGNYLFYDWVRAGIAENKPYDQFVRELLTASGDVAQTPAVSWYRQVKEPTEQTEDTAQLFLGVRIQCAKCHHHPFEKWSQNDYYGLDAFFSRIERKGADGGGQQDDLRIIEKRGKAEARNPMTEKMVSATGLGASPADVSPDESPRAKLVDWMVAKDNPFFAKSLVNRYWKHFFGRGIVDPEDDMRETNPPTNPKLLAALASNFTAHNYDLKGLIREICRSNAYQLSSVPNEFNVHDRQSFSRHFPRRLTAEVLLDAIDQVNGTTTSFRGVANGSRAVQLPDHGGASDSYFLQVFGRPAGGSACECERTGDTSLAQCLHLLNSSDVYDKLQGGVARSMSAADDKRPDEAKIADLYMAALSRAPKAVEVQTSIAYVERALAAREGDERPVEEKRRQAYEDLLWALVNTKEFLFNH